MKLSNAAVRKMMVRRTISKQFGEFLTEDEGLQHLTIWLRKPTELKDRKVCS